jgi:hypothetical protein
MPQYEIRFIRSASGFFMERFQHSSSEAPQRSGFRQVHSAAGRSCRNPVLMELSRKVRTIVSGDPGLAIFSEHHDHTRHIEDTD